MLENRKEEEIKALSTKVRVDNLKMMSAFISDLDDSDIYESWAEYAIPDEATDETLQMIASDEFEYYDIKSYFIRLISDWL